MERKLCIITIIGNSNSMTISNNLKYMNIYYVYKHIIKKTGEVFYVGRGKNNRAWDKNGRNSYWKKITNKYTYIIEIVKEKLYIQESKDLEIALICEFKPKANFTKGGDGTLGYRFDPDFVKERNQKNKDLWNDEVWVKNRNEKLTQAMNRPEIKENVSKGLLEFHNKRRAEGRPFRINPHFWSEEEKKEISNRQKGDKGYWYGKITAPAKKVIDLDTGEIFPTIKLAAKSVNGFRTKLSKSLKEGRNTYKKHRFRYYEEK